MIEVAVDSVRVSLMNHNRIVVLKDINNERFLPIFVDQFVAEAITLELQQTKQPRPMTHDLLRSTIEAMGGRVVHVLVNDLRKDIYYARIVIELADGNQIEIDARPSDSIALAVRAKAPIFVAEAIMEKSAFTPEEDVDLSEGEEEEVAEAPSSEVPDEEEDEDIDESQFSAFADFVNSLDLDELDDEDKN